MTKEDFYCGAFLSVLLNEGINPALFLGNDISNRKIYDFTSDNRDYRVYVKYTEKPTSCSEAHKSRLWTIQFTKEQIKELQSIFDTEKENKVVLICGEKKLSQTQLVVTEPEVIFKCLNMSKINEDDSQSVRVKIKKSERNYSLYGTGRADMLNGEDNTIKVSKKNFFV